MSAVVEKIHPQDHMWNTGKDWYFSVGQSGLQAVKTAVSLASLKGVNSFLDLPCGHGRVGRYLHSAYPNAKGYYCDIDRSGVEFCAKTFSGTGIFSEPELTRVSLPHVDVIWVGSLFTHVDRTRAERWLAYLADHLNLNGVLVATFHGHWSVEVQKVAPMIDDDSWQKIMRHASTTGYGYAKYPNNDLGDYGVSLTRPGVVCDMVSAIPGVRLIGYMERGWADNHDVVMLKRHDRLAAW